MLIEIDLIKKQIQKYFYLENMEDQKSFNMENMKMALSPSFPPCFWFVSFKSGCFLHKAFLFHLIFPKVWTRGEFIILWLWLQPVAMGMSVI